MNYSVVIAGDHYSELRKHLYPGDGFEAVAVAFCGRHTLGNETKILFHRLIPIPYESCEIRTPDFIKWSTSILIPHLTEASKKGWAVVKIHSHPGGYSEFSDTDNHSDKDLFDSVYGWMDDENPHGSLIMLPNGKLFGRVILPDLSFESIQKVTVVSDDINFWFAEELNATGEEFSKRTAQAFGLGTTNLLKRLKIGIVGCSGTGSPTVEQLVRLGIGSIVIIDPDKVEEKNLNRILSTVRADVISSRYKVDVLAEYINKIDLGTKVKTFKENLYDSKEAIHTLASCDVIFGCVDSVDGRHLLNNISSFYLIPYFDLGVKIIADGKGSVDQICGAIHYLQPGGSSLKSRGVYTGEELRSTSMLRTNKVAYEEQKKSGYIVNVNVESPAVISINMLTSSLAVNEFLARIHPFRYDSNGESAIKRFSLTDDYFQNDVDGEPDSYLKKFVGRGYLLPLLNMPELS